APVIQAVLLRSPGRRKRCVCRDCLIWCAPRSDDATLVLQESFSSCRCAPALGPPPCMASDCVWLDSRHHLPDARLCDILLPTVGGKPRGEPISSPDRRASYPLPLQRVFRQQPDRRRTPDDDLDCANRPDLAKSRTVRKWPDSRRPADVLFGDPIRLCQGLGGPTPLLDRTDPPYAGHPAGFRGRHRTQAAMDACLPPMERIAVSAQPSWFVHQYQGNQPQLE